MLKPGQCTTEAVACKVISDLNNQHRVIVAQDARVNPRACFIAASVHKGPLYPARAMSGFHEIGKG